VDERLGVRTDAPVNRLTPIRRECSDIRQEAPGDAFVKKLTTVPTSSVNNV
jgi:hypothetical protein